MAYGTDCWGTGALAASGCTQAGYDAKRINDAGYSAAEADAAGYTVPQMFAAKYSAGGLKEAGHSALVLREAGYELPALMGAFYTAEELVEAGYTVQEIKEVCLRVRVRVCATCSVQRRAMCNVLVLVLVHGCAHGVRRRVAFTASHSACHVPMRLPSMHPPPRPPHAQCVMALCTDAGGHVASTAEDGWHGDGNPQGLGLHGRAPQAARLHRCGARVWGARASRHQNKGGRCR